MWLAEHLLHKTYRLALVMRPGCDGLEYEHHSLEYLVPSREMCNDVFDTAYGGSSFSGTTRRKDKRTVWCHYKSLVREARKTLVDRYKFAFMSGSIKPAVFYNFMEEHEPVHSHLMFEMRRRIDDIKTCEWLDRIITDEQQEESSEFIDSEDRPVPLPTVTSGQWIFVALYVLFLMFVANLINFPRVEAGCITFSDYKDYSAMNHLNFSYLTPTDLYNDFIDYTADCVPNVDEQVFDTVLHGLNKLFLYTAYVPHVFSWLQQLSEYAVYFQADYIKMYVCLILAVALKSPAIFFLSFGITYVPLSTGWTSVHPLAGVFMPLVTMFLTRAFGIFVAFASYGLLFCVAFYHQYRLRNRRLESAHSPKSFFLITFSTVIGIKILDYFGFLNVNIAGGVTLLYVVWLLYGLKIAEYTKYTIVACDYKDGKQVARPQQYEVYRYAKFPYTLGNFNYIGWLLTVTGFNRALEASDLDLAADRLRDEHRRLVAGGVEQADNLPPAGVYTPARGAAIPPPEVYAEEESQPLPSYESCESQLNYMYSLYSSKEDPSVMLNDPEFKRVWEARARQHPLRLNKKKKEATGNINVLPVVKPLEHVVPHVCYHHPSSCPRRLGVTQTVCGVDCGNAKCSHSRDCPRNPLLESCDSKGRTKKIVKYESKKKQKTSRVLKHRMNDALKKSKRSSVKFIHRKPGQKRPQHWYDPEVEISMLENDKVWEPFDWSRHTLPDSGVFHVHNNETGVDEIVVLNPNQCFSNMSYDEIYSFMEDVEDPRDNAQHQYIYGNYRDNRLDFDPDFEDEYFRYEEAVVLNRTTNKVSQEVHLTEDETAAAFEQLLADKKEAAMRTDVKTVTTQEVVTTPSETATLIKLVAALTERMESSEKRTEVIQNLLITSLKDAQKQPSVKEARVSERNKVKFPAKLPMALVEVKSPFRRAHGVYTEKGVVCNKHVFQERGTSDITFDAQIASCATPTNWTSVKDKTKFHSFKLPAKDKDKIVQFLGDQTRSHEDLIVISCIVDGAVALPLSAFSVCGLVSLDKDVGLIKSNETATGKTLLYRDEKYGTMLGVNFNTEEGDCGSPYVIAGSIVAIHCIGDKDVANAGIPITQEVKTFLNSLPKNG